jgi:hypothetical protein
LGINAHGFQGLSYVLLKGSAFGSLPFTLVRVGRSEAVGCLRGQLCYSLL